MQIKTIIRCHYIRSRITRIRLAQVLLGARGSWKPMCWWVCVCAYSVVSDSLRPHGLEPARLLWPWNLLGRTLEWAAISYSREPSWPRDQTHTSGVSCPVMQTLDHWRYLGSPSVAGGNENWCSPFKNSMVGFYKVKHILHTCTLPPHTGQQSYS